MQRNPNFVKNWSIIKLQMRNSLKEIKMSTVTEILNKLDKEEVLKFLDSFETDIILLCYEKSGDFCHRHIVADWIESELKKRVEEYPI